MGVVLNIIEVEIIDLLGLTLFQNFKPLFYIPFTYLSIILLLCSTIFLEYYAFSFYNEFSFNYSRIINIKSSYKKIAKVHLFIIDLKIIFLEISIS